ncbi:MAG: nitroreductase family protein [Candidatus Aenigmatarchaeota archaeon]|nr:MAG: nitroreductase family protein [Candidatus Aenigmarchaeota archaeon]
MDVLDAIQKRRSVTEFQEKKVEMEKVGVLLEAIRWAPSAGNRQPWEVVVIDDRKTIEDLADIAHNQHWLKKAPLVMVVCINHKLAEGTFGVRGKNLYAIQATATAAENAMLTATELGLGTCWIDVYDEEKASRLLACPKHTVPVIALAVGYPLAVPKPPPRYEIASFSYYNGHGKLLEFEWKGIAEHLKEFKERLLKSLEKY